MIPPYDLTVTRIDGTGVRIEKFVALNGRMPRTLSELPSEPNRDCETTDAWGRPLCWSYDAPAAKFTVWSLGRDGKSGGTGVDEDIYITFDVRPDGRSSPPQPHGAKENGPASDLGGKGDGHQK
jgi:hypothetical protein